MTTEIKAIETFYQGRMFRSRLEARWAVFFDAAGILWEYEPEGYDTPDGKYLPDFRIYLRGYGNKAWIFEVKSQNQLELNDQCICPSLDPRWFHAVEGSRLPMLVACGIPSGQQVEKWMALTGGLQMLGRNMLGGKYADENPHGVHYPYNIFGTCPCCDRSVIVQCANQVEQWNGRIIKKISVVNDRIRSAFDAATSARFEYGKRGD